MSPPSAINFLHLLSQTVALPRSVLLSCTWSKGKSIQNVTFVETVENSTYRSGDEAQLVELLPTMHEAHIKLGMVAHTCNLSTQEAEVGVGMGSKVQGHSWLHDEFEASLGYKRPGLRKTQTEKQPSSKWTSDSTKRSMKTPLTTLAPFLLPGLTFPLPSCLFYLILGFLFVCLSFLLRRVSLWNSGCPGTWCVDLDQPWTHRDSTFLCLWGACSITPSLLVVHLKLWITQLNGGHPASTATERRLRRSSLLLDHEQLPSASSSAGSQGHRDHGDC